MVQMAANVSAMQETGVQSLSQGDALEEGMATHSSILAWRTPRTEERGGPQCMDSQGVGHDRATFTHSHVCTSVMWVGWRGSHWNLCCTLIYPYSRRFSSRDIN